MGVENEANADPPLTFFSSLFSYRRYYSRLTYDFQINKKICEEIAIIPSKRLRNKISGFVTHLMKRITRGSVRGISLKLQEEERERRMDTLPDKSFCDIESLTLNGPVREMLESLNIKVPVSVINQEDVDGRANQRIMN
eukprot:GHVH01008762.1.p1 GENE.GHVH01008762.1~~GHVH01008762.1.p1  ORF type:complete len:139 (+),score=25.89 GHVH01008762.1:133-549(+)